MSFTAKPTMPCPQHHYTATSSLQHDVEQKQRFWCAFHNRGRCCAFLLAAPSSTQVSCLASTPARTLTSPLTVLHVFSSLTHSQQVTSHRLLLVPRLTRLTGPRAAQPSRCPRRNQVRQTGLVRKNRSCSSSSSRHRHRHRHRHRNRNRNRNKNRLRNRPQQQRLRMSSRSSRVKSSRSHSC